MSERPPQPPQPVDDDDDDEQVREKGKQDAKVLLSYGHAVGSGVAQGAGAVVGGVAAAAPKIQAGAEAAWDGAKRGAQFVRENAGVVSDGVAAGAEAIRNGAAYVVEKLPGGEYMKQGLQAGYDAAADTFGPTLEKIREVVSAQLVTLRKQLEELMEPDPDFDFNQMVEDILRPILAGTAKSMAVVYKSLNRLSVYMSSLVYTLAVDLADEAFPELQKTVDQMRKDVEKVVSPARKGIENANSAVKQGMGSVSNGVRSITDSVTSGVESVSSNVQGGYTAATTAVGGGATGVRERVGKELERLQTVLGGLVEAGTNVSVFERIKGMVQPIIDGTVRRAEDIRQILGSVREYFASTVNGMLGRKDPELLEEAEKRMSNIHSDIENQIGAAEDESTTGRTEEEEEEGEDAEDGTEEAEDVKVEVGEEEEEGNEEELEEEVAGEIRTLQKVPVSDEEPPQVVLGQERKEEVQVMVVKVDPKSAEMGQKSANGASVESYVSGENNISVKERIKQIEANGAIAAAELAKPRPIPNRAKGRNLAVSDEATQMFNELCLQPFSVQAEAFLNAYWEEVGSQAPFIFEVAYEMMKQVDMRFKGISLYSQYEEGNRLSENAALYFYEQLYRFVMQDPRGERWRTEKFSDSEPEMLTAVSRRRKLKSIDKNYDRHISFIEYLLDQYKDVTGVDPDEFMMRHREVVEVEVEEEEKVEAIERAEAKVTKIQEEMAAILRKKQALLKRVEDAKAQGHAAKQRVAERELDNLMKDPKNEGLRVALIHAEGVVKRLQLRVAPFRPAGSS